MSSSSGAGSVDDRAPAMARLRLMWPRPWVSWEYRATRGRRLPTVGSASWHGGRGGEDRVKGMLLAQAAGERNMGNLRRHHERTVRPA
jgi:hypothetical protein